MAPALTHFTSILALLPLLAITLATPVVKVRQNSIRLPVAKRFNFTGTTGVLERDQARARNLRSRAAARSRGARPSPELANVPATNQVVQYVVDVGIGTPPTTYALLVDTGSSNTWVGAGQTYVQTSTTRETRDSVAVTYGSGSVSGVEFTDTLSLGNRLTVSGQSIGVASEQQGFDGIDGIIGLGPTGLTLGTLFPEGTTIPTVTDNLFSQGHISTDQVSISFEPTQSVTIVNGELTFGDIDTSKFVGAINFVPITEISPSSEFFGIEQSIKYGTSTTILDHTAGIVDTGTTLILIATDALEVYTSATGAVFDQTTGLLRLTPAQFANLKSLFFTIGGVVFEFTANAQIWPRVLNAEIGGSADYIYLILGDIGTPSGSGLDVINGMTFIERFYTVFDTQNNRVGIANTPFTRATTN
ncbi:aspartic proteinase from Irpex Lacteus [Trametes meyenii]|nr:aspartic proteinase from Irpex Lacteus [Trametes meyenii]